MIKEKLKFSKQVNRIGTSWGIVIERSRLKQLGYSELDLRKGIELMFTIEHQSKPELDRIKKEEMFKIASNFAGEEVEKIVIEKVPLISKEGKEGCCFL